MSIYQFCSPDLQARLTTTHGNTYNVYGTVNQGASGNRGWDAQFDMFSLKNNTVKCITRQNLVMLEEGYDEPECDRPVDIVALDSSFKSRAQVENCKTPKEEFLLMDTDDLTSVRAFKLQWGKEKSDMIDRNILEDSEDVDLGMPAVEDHTATDNIEFDGDTTLSQTFFDHIFPSIVGHSKLMDEYFSDPKDNF
jgi:hypothetical protein